MMAIKDMTVNSLQQAAGLCDKTPSPGETTVCCPTQISASSPGSFSKTRAVARNEFCDTGGRAAGGKSNVANRAIQQQ